MTETCPSSSTRNSKVSWSVATAIGHAKDDAARSRSPYKRRFDPLLLNKLITDNKVAGRYKVDRSKISVSGGDSGGDMATQMHVAYSSVFMGVGVIAGSKQQWRFCYPIWSFTLWLSLTSFHYVSATIFQMKHNVYKTCALMFSESITLLTLFLTPVACVRLCHRIANGSNLPGI